MKNIVRGGGGEGGWHARKSQNGQKTEKKPAHLHLLIILTYLLTLTIVVDIDRVKDLRYLHLLCAGIHLSKFNGRDGDDDVRCEWTVQIMWLFGTLEGVMRTEKEFYRIAFKFQNKKQRKQTTKKTNIADVSWVIILQSNSVEQFTTSRHQQHSSLLPPLFFPSNTTLCENRSIMGST